MLLDARDIVKVFGSGAGEVRPLKGVDLKLYAGELTLLMGPSGSGKTTLLSILGCILSPTEGELEVAGNSTHGLDAEGLAKHPAPARRLRVPGLQSVPHDDGERERDAGARRARAQPVVDPPTHALDALIAVGLGHRAKAFPAKLSGGEKQRVALARALAGAAIVILADEPTAALDAENGRAVMALLRRSPKIPTELFSPLHTITARCRMQTASSASRMGKFTATSGRKKTPFRSTPIRTTTPCITRRNR